MCASTFGIYTVNSKRAFIIVSIAYNIAFQSVRHLGYFDTRALESVAKFKELPNSICIISVLLIRIVYSYLYFCYLLQFVTTVRPTMPTSIFWELLSVSACESLSTFSTSSELLFSALAELCIRKKIGEC